MKLRFFLILLALIIEGCATPSAPYVMLPLDEQPMYGGLDRQSIPEVKKGDEDFIRKTSAAFGGRERAAAAWVDQGFRFYKSGNLKFAMRRFNQAWLLDPKNPEVYWGFGVVLHDRDQAFAAYDMLKRAYDLGFRNPGFPANLGKMALVRIVERQDLSESQKVAFRNESEQYFEEAVKSQTSLAYIYECWASARYWDKDYKGAWEKIAIARKYGELPSPGFLDVLSAKMPEPK